MNGEDEITDRINKAIQKYAHDRGRAEGRKEGAEDKRDELIYNLLNETDLKEAKIAMVARVPLELVEEIMAELKKDQEKAREEARLKRKWDHKAVMDFHEDKGRKVGLEKGLKEGLEIGRKEVRKKAAQEKEVEFVSNMIKITEFDDARIAFLVGVTVARVQEIRTEIKKKKDADCSSS